MFQLNKLIKKLSCGQFTMELNSCSEVLGEFLWYQAFQMNGPSCYQKTVSVQCTQRLPRQLQGGRQKPPGGCWAILEVLAGQEATQPGALARMVMPASYEVVTSAT